jgi:hypothetical protein
MAKKPSRAFKVGSVVWALVLGAAVLILGASILLPSTKRARIDFRQMHEESDDAATQPASQPTTGPAAASRE